MQKGILGLLMLRTDLMAAGGKTWRGKYTDESNTDTKDAGLGNGKNKVT